MSLEIGQLIDGKYRIVRIIGEGGMGAVYEGQNVRINRRVAIKVLHAAFTGNTEVMQRFEREASAAGRIGNDHILEVIDLGSLADGDHFIVMEFLDGEPLSARIQSRRRLTPQELTPLIRQTLVGLNAAHAAGIIHRDLKPDNVFILREKAGSRDFVKLIDFGISKFQPLSGDGMKMTRTGAVMGTPYYMSPEQASGSQDADQRSDLYSIGVIMFEAVTGRVPFDAGTFNQLMFKIVLAEVPTVESLVNDVDPADSSIIAKAMARDVQHRFQSAEEFIRALDDWATRGAAVSLPPAGDAVTAGLVPGGAYRGRMGSTGEMAPAPGRTGGNWATSQPGPEVDALPKKSSGGKVAAIAAVALLAVGGVAFGAVKLLGGNGAPEARTAESAVSPPVTKESAAPAPSVVDAPPPAIDVSPAGSAATAPSASPSAAPSASAASGRPLARAPLAAAPRLPAPVNHAPAAKSASPGKPKNPDFGY